MVAPLPDIQREISQLTQEAGKLHQQFSAAYQTYLSTLSNSVQSQLVQVCFTLCTERHAQQFLALSLTERQTLQQEIQKLGVTLGEDLIQQGENSLQPDATPITPQALYEIIQSLEANIVERLRDTSLAVNRLLEKYNILTIKSLDTLFEIAAKAEKAGRSITNPPLLVKAIVDLKEDDEDPPVQPLTAIYLQIADLEFADPQLLGVRQPIRQLRQTLDRLQKSHSQKLEESVMAEASAAWRASWYIYEPDHRT